MKTKNILCTNSVKNSDAIVECCVCFYDVAANPMFMLCEQTALCVLALALYHY